MRRGESRRVVAGVVGVGVEDEVEVVVTKEEDAIGERDAKVGMGPRLLQEGDAKHAAMSFFSFLFLLVLLALVV